MTATAVAAVSTAAGRTTARPNHTRSSSMSVPALRIRHALAILATGAVAVFPVVSAAQGDPSLPAAKDLIARYSKEVGGDAWKSHKSARMKATMDMPGVGNANLEVLQVFPNVVVTNMDIPGMGTVKSGFDGNVAWSINPMTGPQLLSGEMAEQAKEQADPEVTSGMSKNIVSAETVEKTTMDGKECYKVKKVWKSGRESYDCYAVDDGLLIATSTKAASPMGEIEVTQYQRDYKDFDGVKRPTTIATEQMGVQTSMKILSWEWDNVDPKEMELPAEIQALVAKKP